MSCTKRPYDSLLEAFHRYVSMVGRQIITSDPFDTEQNKFSMTGDDGPFFFLFI